MYEDFDLSDIFQTDPDFITDWRGMLIMRRDLQRPNLSWYVDKVARKRWLPQHGYPQATQYYLKYHDEILNDAITTISESDNDTNTKTNNKTLVSKEIQKNLPKDHGYCAKVSHMVSSYMYDG